MSLQLNTPPATEPVTLAQAKAWLKVETDDEDALIAALIPAARARAEWHTGRAFVTQGWTLWLDRVGDCVELPLPPLAGVESVTLYAADDAATLLAEDGYRGVGGCFSRARTRACARITARRLRSRGLWRRGRCASAHRQRDPAAGGAAL
jgi:uncharacterized phiE125 gp8 family phage protein